MQFSRNKQSRCLRLGVFWLSFQLLTLWALMPRPLLGEETTPVAHGVEDPWAITQESSGEGYEEPGYFELLPELRDLQVRDEAVTLDVAEEVAAYETKRFTMDIPEAGTYYLGFDYEVPGESIAELKIDVLINGKRPYPEAQNVALPVLWEIKDEGLKIDPYQNQTYPISQRLHQDFEHFLGHDLFNLNEPLLFPFEEGEQEITLINQEIPFTIHSLKLRGADLLEEEAVAPQASGASDASDSADASDVPAATLAQEGAGDFSSFARSPLLVVEGEDPVSKTHAHIRGERTKNVNCIPFDPEVTLINILSGRTWMAPGEGVTYRFKVEEEGYYRLGLRYIQSDKQDIPVFKNIRVDGAYPDALFQNYPVPYTASQVQVHWIGDASEEHPEALLYLTAGEHDISLESTAAPYFEAYERLLRVIREMNLLTLDIKTVTGNKVDIHRDWSIEQFIPDIEERITRLTTELDVIYEELSALSGQQEVPQWTNLRIIRDRIARYLVDKKNDRGLDRLVNNLDIFSQGEGSMAEQLGLALQQMLDQPLDIDQVYLAGEDLSELPGFPDFAATVGSNFQKLNASFSAKSPSLEIEDDVLNVWVQRPVTFIDVLREMVEQEFSDTGIKVNLSAMPDENRLLMSVIAGEAPDIALGVTTGRPYDFALRGAVQDLREFEDFPDVTTSYTAEMMLPFAFEDGIYALPETADFYVLFYRKDIMSHLGLELPHTWDELIDILPALDRQGLGVQTMIATAGGFKHFGTTVPLIQQFEGKVYQDDGLGVAFDDPNTIEAMEFLTDLYLRYSLPLRIANFYNSFKSGLVPLGVSNLGSYVLLKHAAPEINGQWGIAPNFGRVNEAGEFISTQPDITSGSIMLAQSEKKDEAWEFLKWWVSPEVQLRYGQELQMRFGKEYVWATANLDALQQVSYIDPKDRDIIVEQVRTAKEIERHPAYFQVERELSNAWNRIVFDGMPVREALDKAALSSNRIIETKLQEFSFLDAEGKVTRPLRILTAEDIESYGNFVDSSPRLYKDVLADLESRRAEEEAVVADDPLDLTPEDQEGEESPPDTAEPPGGTESPDAAEPPDVTEPPDDMTESTEKDKRSATDKTAETAPANDKPAGKKDAKDKREEAKP